MTTDKRFSPTDDQEKVLSVLKSGRETGRPWGRANPKYIEERTGIRKANVLYALRELTEARWVRKPARGCYEFVRDPREDSDSN